MEFGAQALLSFNMETGGMKINFGFTVAGKQSREVWISGSGYPVPAVADGHGWIFRGKEAPGT